jgi:SAM-dependent methyltransferase
MTHQQESDMRPKPELYNSHYAEWFKDPDVIAAYPSRPPYARAAIEFLSELITDRPRRVLDIGCGTGDIARRLAPLVDRVDAVDFSAEWSRPAENFQVALPRMCVGLSGRSKTSGWTHRMGWLRLGKACTGWIGRSFYPAWLTYCRLVS